MEPTEVTDNNPQIASVPYDNPADVTRPVVSPFRVPLFALIIGIDSYPNIGKLSGAVADGKALKNYLEEVFRTPEDHICTLFDGQATRDAIIKAFEDLRADQRICHGDPIVIHYSGHGSELPSPTAWDADGKIQCILPYDYEHGKIYPIPDRSIGTLIQGIANAKGDNITVIFDCCHSASGTRDQDEKYVPRSVALGDNIPKDLDSEIWGDRASTIPPALAYYGLRSHVLLAACRKQELAYEYEGRGQFTTALLATLKQSALNILTYAKLLGRIQLPKQHPQCEGDNQHRILFNARVVAGRQVRHLVARIQDLEYVISAGLAHGVSHGVEFTLYSNDRERMNVITVDDTAKIEDFQTVVTTSVHFANDSFAVLSRVGKVPFCLAPGGSLPASFVATLNGDNANAANFRLVEKADEAKLEVAVEDQRVAFKVLDQRANEFGLTHLSHTIPLRGLAHVLSAASHYYWYLDLTNKNNRIRHAVTVDFYPLDLDYDAWGNELWTPIEPSLGRRDRSSGDSELDVIDIVIDPKERYGIKITNNTQWDLYLNAFLFNSSQLSIDQCYTQPSTGDPDAPLAHDGIFTIGYGPGGTAPLAFSLDEGQDVDVSYLKFYFATQPIDLSRIVQTSPIDNLEERESTEEEARKARLSLSKPTQARKGPEDTWFTVEIPLVQRRK